MKRGTPDHPKTKRLATILGVKRFEVVGILESLWHFTAQYAKRGDIGKWSNEEIASAIEWPCDPDSFIDALTVVGYLDQCKEHRLLVHDWKEHADQTVHRSEEIKKLGFAELSAVKSNNKLGNASRKLANASILQGNDDSQLANASQPMPCLALPEPSHIAAVPPASSTRKPNELFDAICEVTGSDPKVNAGRIAKTCQTLQKANPPYTADEVRKWADLIAVEGWPPGKPTIGLLEQRIGTIRDKKHIEGVKRGKANIGGSTSPARIRSEPGKYDGIREIVVGESEPCDSATGPP